MSNLQLISYQKKKILQLIYFLSAYTHYLVQKFVYSNNNNNIIFYKISLKKYSYNNILV